MSELMEKFFAYLPPRVDALPSAAKACSTSLARSTGHSAISDDKVVGIISSSKKVLIRHHSLVPPMNFRPTNDVIQPTMLDYMYVEFNSPILLFGA